MPARLSASLALIRALEAWLDFANSHMRLCKAIGVPLPPSFETAYLIAKQVLVQKRSQI